MRTKFFITVAIMSFMPLLIFPQQKITGGHNISISQAPWQVLLTCDGTPFGAGVIIDSQYILTAKHCAREHLWGQLHVIVGTSSSSTYNSSNVYAVPESDENIIYHPTLDVALLKLSKPLSFNDNVQPVDISHSTDAKYYQVGTSAIATGWGRECPECSMSENLNSVDVHIISAESASKALQEQGFRAVSKDEIATAGSGASRQGPCHGDSGGPLVTWSEEEDQYVLIGITSRGIPNCIGNNENSPAVYVKVSSVFTWIHAILNGTSINGADVLCDEEVYTLKGLPEGADVYWSFGESGVAYVFPPLEIIDGQGTAQATFKRKGEYQLYIDENGVSHPVLIPYVGTQTIKATVTLNGNSCVLEKEVTMPDPEDELDMRIRDVNQTGLLPLMYFGGATIELALRTPVDEETARNIEWECVLEPDPNSTPASLGMTMTFTGNSVEIPTPLAFTGTVRVTATNTAACNNTGTFTTEVIASVMYIDFTNPTSGSVDVSVKETAAGTQEGVAAMSADAEVYAEPYMGEYRLELWHEVYGMVREMDVEAGNPTVTMDLGGLTPGWYYVRLIADGEMKAVGKLMVR